MTTRIDRSALVMFSARQMFDLVNDIENYPLFMQGCQQARVLSRSETEVVGELVLGKAGLQHSFTTRNILKPCEEMQMSLVEGPFRKFSASWRFQSLAENACKVSLQMEFDFAGGLVGYALEKLFNHSANSLVDSVVARANQLYAKPIS
ncbi:MAG: ubiquinone-binding protein [Gammaproteobacteria bacterium RIFCSPLOWO2_02_FULL_57_10]|nr:MAG: ubiquinone-binding protein [Gammaproteobacteria bacterium RIFCSPLOWO2_02_FULL_57_10]